MGWLDQSGDAGFWVGEQTPTHLLDTSCFETGRVSAVSFIPARLVSALVRLLYHSARLIPSTFHGFSRERELAARYSGLVFMPFSLRFLRRLPLARILE